MSKHSDFANQLLDSELRTDGNLFYPQHTAEEKSNAAKSSSLAISTWRYNVLWSKHQIRFSLKVIYWQHSKNSCFLISSWIDWRYFDKSTKQVFCLFSLVTLKNSCFLFSSQHLDWIYNVIWWKHQIGCAV